MDMNLTVISGRLAAPPEFRAFESGTRVVRVLVTTRQEEPHRRVDVVPAALWDPDEATMLALEKARPGQRVWLVGSIQRRFWTEEGEGRRSRLEVIADSISSL
jgi:single-stranded DNA-binding protein